MHVEFNNEVALEETQMDLIMKYDNAFKWNAEDDKKVKTEQRTVKRKQ
jgi:queuine/archaeosine tRNA-ribosyltransferase